MHAEVWTAAGIRIIARVIMSQNLWGPLKHSYRDFRAHQSGLDNCSRRKRGASKSEPIFQSKSQRSP